MEPLFFIRLFSWNWSFVDACAVFTKETNTRHMQGGPRGETKQKKKVGVRAGGVVTKHGD